MAVLCVLVTIGMLAASAVALSKTQAEGMAVSSGRNLSCYAAESCASRMQWVLMQEMESHPDRELCKKDPENRGIPHVFADGAIHNISAYNYEGDCAIRDMICGIEASSAAIGALMRDRMPSKDKSQQNDLDTLTDRIEDYCDADDFVRAKGMERQDYNAAGLKGLPRNGPIRFKEELALIPGFETLFPEPEKGVMDCFRPVAPVGLPQPMGRPSFMAANAFLIGKLCKFDAKTLDLVLTARDLWRNEGREPKESLDPSTIQKLRDSLAFTESGFYTFETTGRADGNPQGTIVMSMRVERQVQGTGIVYYEWLQY